MHFRLSPALQSPNCPNGHRDEIRFCFFELVSDHVQYLPSGLPRGRRVIERASSRGCFSLSSFFFFLFFFFFFLSISLFLIIFLSFPCSMAIKQPYCGHLVMYFMHRGEASAARHWYPSRCFVCNCRTNNSRGSRSVYFYLTHRAFKEALVLVWGLNGANG